MAYKLPDDVTLGHAKDLAETFGTALIALLSPRVFGQPNKGVYVTVGDANYILSGLAYTEEIMVMRTEMVLPNGTLIEAINGAKITVDLSGLSLNMEYSK